MKTNFFMTLENEVLEILDNNQMIAVRGGLEDRKEFNDRKTCSATNNGTDCFVVNNSKSCVLINNSKETCTLTNTNKTCTIVAEPKPNS